MESKSTEQKTMESEFGVEATIELAAKTLHQDGQDLLEIASLLDEYVLLNHRSSLESAEKIASRSGLNNYIGEDIRKWLKSIP